MALRLLTLATLLGAMALGAWAQQISLRQGSTTFEIRGENMALVSSGLIGERIEFEASANPLTADSPAQGLTLRMRRIAGHADPDAQGRYFLSEARIEGAVTAAIVADGARYDLQTSRLDLTDGPDRAIATLPGSFTLVENASIGGSSRLLRIEGGSGTFRLDPLRAAGDQPLSSAEVRGPVKISLSSTRSNDAQTQQLEIEASGDRLVFERAVEIDGRSFGRLQLLGNVSGVGTNRPVGDGPGSQYTYDADSLIVLLDENLEIARIDTQARAGRLTVEEDDGP